MATYLMFGRYSAEAAKSISASRTKKSMDVIKKAQEIEKLAKSVKEKMKFVY